MFDGLWPAFDEAEVPITSITNGVHAPTWVAREVFELAAGQGADPDADDTDAFCDAVDKIPGDATSGRPSGCCGSVWSTTPGRGCAQSWTKRGAATAELGWVDAALDPDVLTIGFARRVPSYKRLTLMLRDPDRLKALLLHPERPIQIVIAGKAHPADEGGKKLIQEMVRFADDPEVRHRIVFLPDYDIAMAQPLYPGCDVWLNNPLRPYEACGTSGMKAALNGGLNLSILDGWWDEWYDGDNGWAIPSADGVDDADRRDDLEADALYDLIENEVAPRFYDVDDDGLPDPLDRDGPAHAQVARPEGARHPDGPRLRPELYAPGRAAPVAAQRDYAGAASWRRGRSGSATAGRGVRVDHVECLGVGDAPELGSGLTVRAFVSLGELVARRRRRSRWCTAGQRGRRARDTSVEVARRSPRPTRAAGTASTAVMLDQHRPVRLHRPRGAQARAARLAGRAGPGGAPRLSSLVTRWNRLG